MNKTVKMADATIQSLSDLKPYYVDAYPDEEITYDLIVNELIKKYQEYTNPEIQEEKKRAILEGYIPISTYGDMQKENTLLEEKQKELAKQIHEIEDSKEEITFQLKEEHKINGELQISLGSRENELSALKLKNKEMANCLLEVRSSLPKFDSRYNTLNSEYEKQCVSLTNDYFKETHLITLHSIAYLLMKHKRRMFTIKDLVSELFFSPEKVESALGLVGYKVLPIRKGISQNQVLYFFDRRYLRW